MPYSYKLVILLRFFMAIKIKKASRFWGVLSVLQISSRCPVNGTLSDLEFKLTGLVLKFLSLLQMEESSTYPPAITCLKLTMKTLEQGVKYVQN